MDIEKITFDDILTSNGTKEIPTFSDVNSELRDYFINEWKWFEIVKYFNSKIGEVEIDNHKQQKSCGYVKYNESSNDYDTCLLSSCVNIHSSKRNMFLNPNDFNLAILFFKEIFINSIIL